MREGTQTQSAHQNGRRALLSSGPLFGMCECCRCAIDCRLHSGCRYSTDACLQSGSHVLSVCACACARGRFVCYTGNLMALMTKLMPKVQCTTHHAPRTTYHALHGHHASRPSCFRSTAAIRDHPRPHTLHCKPGLVFFCTRCPCHHTPCSMYENVWPWPDVVPL